MTPALKQAFDSIQPALFIQLLTKSLLTKKSYEKLVRRSDGEHYMPVYFTEDRISRFQVVFVTSSRTPDDDFLELVFPIWVDGREAG